jgi:hypothetical protein
LPQPDDHRKEIPALRRQDILLVRAAVGRWGKLKTAPNQGQEDAEGNQDSEEELGMNSRF